MEDGDNYLDEEENAVLRINEKEKARNEKEKGSEKGSEKALVQKLPEEGTSTKTTKTGSNTNTVVMGSVLGKRKLSAIFFRENRFFDFREKKSEMIKPEMIYTNDLKLFSVRDCSNGQSHTPRSKIGAAWFD